MADNEEVDLKESPKEVDINSLDLADTEVEDSGADAFAGPPPPPDGDHLAKLGIGKPAVQAGKTTQGAPYFMVSVEARLIAPGERYDNAPVFDRASTMVMQSTGTSRVAGILRVLGETLQSRLSIRDVTKMLVDRLHGEPQSIVQTQWTLFCKDCSDLAKATKGVQGKKGGIVLRGEKRFPENGDGTHRHIVECPNCGSLLTARAEILRYKPAPTT